MADTPRSSDADAYLARFGGSGADVGEGAIMRTIAAAAFFKRTRKVATKEEIDVELDRIHEDARTRVALDRLDDLKDE